jgi:hypothetical protein
MSDEYGNNWRRIVYNELNFTFVYEMDYLLGQEVKMSLPEHWRKIGYISETHPDGRCWSISPEYVTKNKSSVPTYKPRKMDRTLESMDSNYKYDVIVFETLNEEQSTYVQEELFKQGYHWSLNNKNVKSFSNYSYPIYLFAKHNSSYITYMTPFELRSYGSGTINDYIKHYSERGNNVCSTVFDYKLSNKMEQLLKWGKVEPSYAPRKVDRTFESVDSKEVKFIKERLATGKYTCINFVVNNRNQAKDVITYLKGLRVNIDTSRIATKEEDGYPYCYTIFTINTGSFDSFLVYGSGDGSHMEDGSFAVGYPQYSVSPVFSVQELKDYIDKIRGIASLMYKPRRIDRTMESFSLKDYPYNSIAFSVSGKSDISKIITWFHDEYDIEKNNELNDIIEEVNDCFHGDYNYRCLIVGFASKSFFLLSPENFESFSKEDSRNFKLDPKIYSVNDLGQFGLAPSYKPRRIERTLEAVESYLPFRIWCNSWEKAIDCEEWLCDEMGWRWDTEDNEDNHDRLVRDDSVSDVETFCNFDKKRMTFDGYDSMNFEGYIIYNYPEDKVRIRNAMGLVPNYEPRRIKRTLEKRNSIDEAYEVSILVNNPDELNTLKEEVEALRVYTWPHISFRLGEYPFYVFFNLVNRDISTASERDMVRHIGRDMDISKSYLFDGVYNIPFKMKDLKHFIKILEDRKISLVPMEVPSYRPRRIDRTLESYNNPMDIHTSKYFTEYNTLVFQCQIRR